MLTIGIHDNVVLSKATKNDKGTLVIGFKKDEEVDVIAAMNGANTSLEAPEQDFLMFAPTIKNFDGTLSDGIDTLKKLNAFKEPLEHILSIYLTNDKIKWDIFNGLTVDATNIYAKLQDQSNVDKVAANIVADFIKMATPFLNNKKKFRLKLVRKNNSKYTALPRFAPFVESMDVPKEASKLKYTAYELTNKLDQPLSAEPTSVSSAEAAEAKSLFA